jgi:oligopeptide transport system ATP-binding protein
MEAFNRDEETGILYPRSTDKSKETHSGYGIGGAMPELLRVKDLETNFRTNEGIIHAVNGVSFHLKEGETLGIVGESGCGKSVTVMSMLHLIPTPPGRVVAGQALSAGQDLITMKDQEIRHILGAEISIIFQDPMTSFNPVLTIGKQLTEPLEIHQNLDRSVSGERAIHMLELVGIPKRRA